MDTIILDNSTVETVIIKISEFPESSRKWDDITDKPAVIAAGDTIQEALEQIGLENVNADITELQEEQITQNEAIALRATTEYVNDEIGNIVEYVNQGDQTNASAIASETNRATTAEATKVDKVSGFGLSEESYTTVEKSKLASITAIFTTALKTAYDSTVTWISTNGTNILNHLSATNNPHNVTKTQVGLGSVDNTPDTAKPLSVLAVASYNAASGVDTPLTNAMSPVQMFQNLQKQTGDRYTKTEGDARYLMIGGLAYTNGFLVKTDIEISTLTIAQICMVQILGTSSSVEPYKIDLSFRVNNSGAIVYFYAVASGITTTVSIFIYNGFLHIYIPYSPASSAYFYGFKQTNQAIFATRKNNIVISVTNDIKPAIIENEVIVTPIKAILNNGTNLNLIKGDGTYQLLSTLPAFTATKLLTARNINGVAFDGSANITISDATKVPATIGVAPASATATGTAGTVIFATDYIYVCTSANTWKRTALTTW